MAFIQGSRRIGDIAKINIGSAIIATIITIAFYYYQGLHGIVPALVISAAIQILISWHYARRLPVPYVNMSWQESFKEAGSMVKLGIAMMWTSLLSSLVSYFTVNMISHQFGVQAIGIYSAAFGLSSVFVSFILQAMGTDYYPRLVGLAGDNNMMNKMVNEQMEIGLLIAVPGVLVMFLFAPQIIQVFYSNEFISATDLLRWCVLGCMGRVVSWPMGYIMLAMGKAKTLLISETLMYMLHAIMICAAVYLYGLDGFGVAFFVLYMVHGVVVYFIAVSLVGFRLMSEVMILISGVVITFAGLFFLVDNYESFWVNINGSVIVIVVSLIAFRMLVFRIMSGDKVLSDIENISHKKYLKY